MIKKKQLKNLALLLSVLLASLVTGDTAAQSQQIENKLRIQAKVSGATTQDTIMLWLYDSFYYLKYPDKLYAVMGPDSIYTFDIAIEDSCGYFQLLKKRVEKPKPDHPYLLLTHAFFWEAGDSIHADIIPKETAGGVYSNATFSGRGAIKYNVWHEIQSRKFRQDTTEKPFLGNLFELMPEHGSITRSRLQLLEKYRCDLSDLAFGVLKADLLSLDLLSAIHLSQGFYFTELENSSPAVKDRFLGAFKASFLPPRQFDIGVSSELRSREYQRYLKILLFSLTLMETEDTRPDSIFSKIDRYIDKDLRGAAYITAFTELGAGPDTQAWYAKAHRMITDPRLKTWLLALEAQKDVDLSGYEFQTIDGQRKKIGDLAGKVLLVDMWFTGCGGCSAYYQNVLRPAADELLQLKNTTLLSLNFDGQSSKLQQGLASGLYTDENATVLTASPDGFRHPFLKDLSIERFPTILLIGKEGKLMAKYQALSSTEAMQRQMKEIIELIKKIN